MELSTLGLGLMTVAIVQFTVVPALADLNRSHATNPGWPAHARFHVVTQVLTTSAIGLVAMYFLWSSRVARDLGVCIATAIALTVLGGFFVSAGLSRYYGGRVGAAQGLAATRLGRIDGNVVNFGLAVVLLVAGRLVFLRAS